jgi:hypothetical protein
MSRACASIPSRSLVITRAVAPRSVLATTTYPWLARYSHKSTFSHDIAEKLGA